MRYITFLGKLQIFQHICQKACKIENGWIFPILESNLVKRKRWRQMALISRPINCRSRSWCVKNIFTSVSSARSPTQLLCIVYIKIAYSHLVPPNALYYERQSHLSYRTSNSVSSSIMSRTFLLWCWQSATYPHIAICHSNFPRWRGDFASLSFIIYFTLPYYPKIYFLLLHIWPASTLLFYLITFNGSLFIGCSGSSAKKTFYEDLGIKMMIIIVP